MAIDDVIKIVKALYEAGIVTTIALPIIKYALAHTRNENIKSFETWTLSIVQGLDNRVMGNADKKDKAMVELRKRLESNKKMSGKFSDRDLDFAIESAVRYIRGDKEVKQ